MKSFVTIICKLQDQVFLLSHKSRNSVLIVYGICDLLQRLVCMGVA